MSPFKKYFAGLSKNTFLLTLSSLFSDISTEMLYPVIPVFLTQTLGAKPTIVGLVDGLATAVQHVTQGLSGWLSDAFQKRKPLALIGSLLSALPKPLIGLCTTWPGVVAARSIDRLGSGMRSAPRDALVAASADEANRGKAFGLEGLGDNLGAFLGPLLAIALIAWLSLPMEWIFYLALIPGLLATLMILLVHETPVAVSAKSKLDLNVGRFGRAYWGYLFVTAVFGIGNSSNYFLIMRMTNLDVSVTNTIFTYAIFNLVAALASYPAGYLSDLLGRKVILLCAFLVFLVVYLGFALTTEITVLVALFVLYGVYQGIFRAVGKAFASDFVPAELRASGVGWYTATVGITGLVASIVAGELWEQINPQAAFYLGAGSSLAGSVALVVLIPRKR